MPNIITIHKPIKLRYKRLKKYKSIVKTVRMYSDESKLIDAICENIGVTPNYFIRWCSLAAAKAIINNGVYDSIDVLVKEK